MAAPLPLPPVILELSWMLTEMLPEVAAAWLVSIRPEVDWMPLCAKIAMELAPLVLIVPR